MNSNDKINKPDKINIKKIADVLNGINDETLSFELKQSILNEKSSNAIKLFNQIKKNKTNQKK